MIVAEPAQLEALESKVSCLALSAPPADCALECVARGDPPLTLHWTHKGRRLDSTVSRFILCSNFLNVINTAE